MPRDKVYRRGSIVGAVLLIGLGVLFLYGNVRPEANPWPVVSRYWPVILIVWGLGRLWDHYQLRSRPESAGTGGLTGGDIAVIAAVVLLVAVALTRRSGTRGEFHWSEAVEPQGATSVRVQIRMGAGELRVGGGASKLLEADFHYNDASLKPETRYEVAGSRGDLMVSQPSTSVHFGQTRNEWDLRLNNDLPMELRVQLGAGRSNFELRGLSLNKLDVEMGAGELLLDLTGDWKKDLEVNVEGGVGSATVRLPENVGVRVHASGGLGSIHTGRLKREGDAYVNDAYGESPVTLRVSIEGGIGEINLVPGP